MQIIKRDKFEEIFENDEGSASNPCALLTPWVIIIRCLDEIYRGCTSAAPLFDTGAWRAISTLCSTYNPKQSKYGTRNRDGNLSDYLMLYAVGYDSPLSRVCMSSEIAVSK